MPDAPMWDPAAYAWRFNAAMAEAGYPDRLSFEGRALFGPAPRVAPAAVVWQALWLAKDGDPHPCWSCWDVANRADPLGPDWEKGRWASDCATGRRGGCHFPEGPPRPPREILR